MYDPRPKTTTSVFSSIAQATQKHPAVENSTLMTRHYPDLGSGSDWLNQISHAA